MIQEAGVCILVINKWDLVKGKKMKEDVKEEIFRIFHSSLTPLMFVSAQSDRFRATSRTSSLVIKQTSTFQRHFNRFSTIWSPEHLHHPLVKVSSRSSGTQVNPPAKFVIFCNKKNYLNRVADMERPSPVLRSHRCTSRNEL